MKKYAKVTNEATGKCLIGTGTNRVFYESLGMSLREVERAGNGQWYLAGRAPQDSEITGEDKARRLRKERDRRLAATDYLLMPDYPLSDIRRQQVMLYRQQLRDLPENPSFPWSGRADDPAVPWPLFPFVKGALCA